MNVRAADAGDFARVLGRQVARYGDRPLVTWYGAGPGERVELSWKTFGNWVAKTANLLVEELGVEPGDRVAILLPAHWQAPVVLAACWVVGAAAVPAGPAVPREAAVAVLAGAACRVAFVHEDLLAEAPDRLRAAAESPMLVAITADLLGRSAGDLGGALPFARVVSAMPDHFDGEGAAPEAEALLLPGPGGHGLSQGELLAAATRLGARLGLSDADRLYSGLGLETADGVTAGVALPLAAGAGVVLEARFRPDALWRRLAEERVALALLRPGQAGALPGTGPPAGLDLSRLRAVVSPEAW
jgi:uncharacterized protein (TIGR03089 family)